MNQTYLTTENFEKEIEKSKLPVLVDFYADWCGPCKMMAPVFEKLSSEFKGKINFLKLDTQQEYALSEKFDVMSIPTSILFHKGKEVGRLSGYMGESTLRDILTKALPKLK